MKTRWKIFVVLLILGGLGAAGYKPAMKYWQERNRPKWRFAEVEQGDIASIVNATGEVKPVLSVHVGAVVSGPIDRLYADFNDEVEKDQLLATIDERIYDSAVKSAEAALNIRHADLRRAESRLYQALNDEYRALALYQENSRFISQAELDQLRFQRESLESEVAVASAAVEQAKANLKNAEANLRYTEIRSPVDGVIIDRKIDEGQALAAQFQAPELFIVAPDLRKEMHIFASVDETDIGLIRDAQETGKPVHFTVDAYPDDLFEGVIHEIRLSSTQIQNVVTYPVVISASNPDLKLLPGMTASISFRVDDRKDVVKIPNSALRFYPEKKFVRKQDHKLLDGAAWEKKEEEEEQDVDLSAEERAEVRRKRNRRHVWVVDGDFLKAMEVEIDLSDSKFSEMVAGDLKKGQKLVIGIDTSKE
jgi:HlyD family secretion protein